MSGSNWLSNVAVGVITLSVVVLCMLFGDWLARNKEQREHWYCQNTYHPKHDAIRSPITKQYQTRKEANQKYHELCQQWRSAQAAVESARVAWVQFCVGLLGVALLVGTFIATAYAAHFAYRAAEATHAGATADQNSAETADKTLREMEVTNKRQLRAYVAFHRATLDDLFGANPTVEVVFINDGQTPAHEYTSECYIALTYFPIFGADLATIPLEGYQSKCVVPPKGPNTVAVSLGRTLADWEKDHVRKRMLSLYVYGWTNYKDAFGDSQWTKFRVMCGGWTKRTSGKMVNCPEGNEMS